MESSKVNIRIFLASPGDVFYERQIARRLIKELREQEGLKLEVVAWDDPEARTLMPVTLTPQQAIIQGLPTPAKCDIVIVLFWGRMGTPLDVDSHGRKPNGEPFASGTEWEYLDARRGFEQNATGLPLIYIYRRSDRPPLPEDTTDVDAVQAYLDQLKGVKEFFYQFKDPETGAIKGIIHQYENPDAFEQQFESHLKLLVQAVLKRKDADAGAGEELGEKRSTFPPEFVGSPYPGLRAFTAEDVPVFFGRGLETASLLKRIAESRFVTVVGASGSGKSSLVAAGVLPRLRQDAIAGSRYWQVVRFTPGEQPFLHLAKALIANIPALQGDLSAESDRASELALFMFQTPGGLAKTLEAALAKEVPYAKILLYVDQFEEALTQAPELYRKPFAEALAHASEHVRVIMTLRADFYHLALPYLEVPLREGTFTLDKPSPIALYEIITRPAHKVGLVFEEGLPERIIEEMGDEPGSLALLAYLLHELYEHCKTKNCVDHADYDRLGGVRGAIGRRAQEVYDKQGEEVKKALPAVFRELVVVGDPEGPPTRKAALYTSLTREETARVLVDALTEARLLVQRDSQAGPVVEVAHEALFRSWPALVEWFDGTRVDLYLLNQAGKAAWEWDRNHRQEAYRWPDERLKLVYEAMSRLAIEKPGDEVFEEFIRPEAERLIRQLDEPGSTHQKRSALGERLAMIGDPRPGVGLGKKGLPEIQWLKVGEGEVEIANRRSMVPAFYIAKYPVTYAQFQAFLEADDGYDHPKWWAKLVKQPMSEQHTKYSNHPRDRISWFQAVAFTRWLSAQRLDRSWTVPLPEQKEHESPGKIRLPTEGEWQLAAQCSRGEYPWGDWHPAYSNTADSGLNHSIAVGMYPLGVSESGAFDMAGNVWEWCLNEFETFSTRLEGENRRSLRGGSFASDRFRARFKVRRADSPFSTNDDYGFRVVFARPVPSE